MHYPDTKNWKTNQARIPFPAKLNFYQQFLFPTRGFFLFFEVLDLSFQN